MKAVERGEILDYVTYEERRDAVRDAVLRVKADRRIHVGKYLTFLFENRETVRYQIQEMTRTERMVKETDILHEIATYNELLGEPGELGCTLLIEIDDPAERGVKLAKWLALPRHLYARLEGGDKVRPIFDERQVGDTRVSAVQYLRFPLGGRVPVAVGTDLDDPEVGVEALLTSAQRAALAADLA